MLELNKIYNMDNLELLKQMKNESVDLIYCDILYNTGKKFKDYNDNLGTTQQAIEWYKPRLIEMKRVLKNTGSIWLQMDNRLLHYIKIEMDKIYGEENFVDQVIWTYTKGGKNTKKFKKAYDSILWYSKSNKYVFNLDEVRVPYTKETLRRQNAESWKKLGIKINPLGQQCTNIWDIPAIKKGNYTHKNQEYTGYDTQKPKKLIERIIKASSKEGDLVADFFCGSGTTMEVAKYLNRNYIGCDINPRAIEITNKRLNEIT